MPPRKKTPAGQGELPGISTMAELKDILWKSADKLRGSMDAAQYKDFVLGLVFLKYVSDAFAERRAQIRDELIADGVPESRHESLPRRQGRVRPRGRLLGARRRPLGRPGRQRQVRRGSAC